DDDITWLISTVEEQQKEMEFLQKQFSELEKKWSIAEQARVELLKEKNRLNDALKGAADVANISGQEIKDLKQIQYELSAELVNKNKNNDHILKENARLREAIEQMLKLSRKQDHYLPVSYLVRLYEIGNEALGVESKCLSKN